MTYISEKNLQKRYYKADFDSFHCHWHCFSTVLFISSIAASWNGILSVVVIFLRHQYLNQSTLYHEDTP